MFHKQTSCLTETAGRVRSAVRFSFRDASIAVREVIKDGVGFETIR